MTRTDALKALQGKAKTMTPAERDALAQRMMDEGAPGDAFERLYRAGWRPTSAQQGDGLDPCGPSCGICHPDEEIRMRAYRQRKRR